MAVVECVEGATYTVTTVADAGPGSLRQAIIDANANPGADQIHFNLAGPAPYTIAPASALPGVTDPVVIDGSTQVGWVGTPIIELNGANAGVVSGIRLFTTQCTIRSLVINRFGLDGILIDEGGSHLIVGNYIGTDVTGTAIRANVQEGVYISGSIGNVIGGVNAADRNVISGNGDAGIYILFSSGTVVRGNYIGTTAGGLSALGNINLGVLINNGSGNTIGGAAAGARNVISGNGNSGIYILNPGSFLNLVQGNRIGATADGGTALGNAGDGVTVYNAGNNTIGGGGSGEGNQISGNLKAGISLQQNSAGNLIQGNLIGTDATGKNAIGNAYAGITLMDATGNTVGGTAFGARNLISGNSQDGVFISTNSSGNSVLGNLIGLDLGGTEPLPNHYHGISIRSAANNTIGGSAAGARNIISGNQNHGIHIVGPSATGNVVRGNFIGTRSVSTNAAPNQGAGIGIAGAQNNTIGGAGAAEANVISGNLDAGIFILGPGATGNVVKGNRIGTDSAGAVAVGNAREGIYLGRVSASQIGGPVAGEGNIISANGTWGLLLVEATNTTVQGNSLGVAANGSTPLGNGNSFSGFHCIEITNYSYQNVIGGETPGAANRVAFAPTRAGINYAGVRVREFANNNLVSGNSIFGNGGLAIDLQGYQVTPNDSCDADSGANQVQNYPVLSQAVTGTTLGIRGSLNSTPNQSFRIQFFASPSCDPLYNSGEGAIFLGARTVLAGNNCVADFFATFPPTVPAGYVITATATDVTGNTSEFSPCVPVDPVPVLGYTLSPDGQTLALGWTNTPGGIVLKETASLSPPINWVTATNVPLVINNRYVVTIPISTVGNRFYLLSFE
jgi:parallel beta-helix repeat protein